MKQNPDVLRINIESKIKNLEQMFNDRYSIDADDYNNNAFYQRFEKINLTILVTLKSIQKRLDYIDEEIHNERIKENNGR